MEQRRQLAFLLRMINNKIKNIIRKSSPGGEKAPGSQLQGGILGYLYHRQEQPVYQRDIEKEFRISRATATNTLQAMERNGFLVRKALDKDARLKRIQMTEEALQGHRKIEDHIEMMNSRMLQGLTVQETDELYRLLDVVMKNLEELDRELGGTEAEGAECSGCQDEAQAGQEGAECPGRSDEAQEGTECPGCSDEAQEGAECPGG